MIEVYTTGEYPTLELSEPVVFTQIVYLNDSFLAEDLYNPGIYSFIIYNLTYLVPTEERYYTESPIIIEIYTQNGRLIEESDEEEMNNYVVFDP